ncbi:MAG: hypothetical protein HQM08_03170 [Candidatus Riflebacteria bacterium]|nr:hypothetical protein [Candidatus Riflebacteria bacterium]
MNFSKNLSVIMLLLVAQLAWANPQPLFQQLHKESGLSETKVSNFNYKAFLADLRIRLSGTGPTVSRASMLLQALEEYRDRSACFPSTVHTSVADALVSVLNTNRLYVGVVDMVSTGFFKLETVSVDESQQGRILLEVADLVTNVKGPFHPLLGSFDDPFPKRSAGLDLLNRVYRDETTPAKVKEIIREGFARDQVCISWDASLINVRSTISQALKQYTTGL